MKRFARVALINLGLIAVAIVAAELVFGSWLFDPNLGALNLPRNERRVFDTAGLMPGGGPIVYTRDEHGFRGAPGQPARIDVVVMGGSTTNERYVDDAQTWVARLQDNFRRGGAQLVFANASIDGQTSVGHLAAIDEWLSKVPGLKPRYALVYIGINDAALREDDIHQYDAMKSPQRSRRMRQYIMNKSALYNFYRTVRGTARARDAHLVHGDLKWFEERWIPIETPADAAVIAAARGPNLAAYARRLEALAAKLAALGAAPIFVTQRRGDHSTIGGVPHARGATIPPTSVDAASKDLALFNEATLAVCARLALKCIDLASRIEFADGDFYDRIHTTPSGSKKIADFLYGELKDKLIAGERAGLNP